MIDPISGNPVPPGAMPQEVRDDVPIQASEGEYVLPANVVRFIGLDKIEKMVQQAQKGLAEMNQNGRIGGEPVEPPPVPQGPPPGPPMMNKGGVVKRKGYASGGWIPQARSSTGEEEEVGYLQQDYLSPYPFYEKSRGYTGIREYKDASGRRMLIPYHNGRALIPIPRGFTEGGEQEKEAKKSPWEPSSDGSTRPGGGQLPDGEMGIDPADPTPMGWEGLSSAASNLGRERSTMENAALTALGLLGPAGRIASMAVNAFQQHQENSTVAAIENTLETGMLPDGTPATQAQLDSLAVTLGQHTGTPVTAPTAVSPVSPVSPIGVPQLGITTTALGPPAAIDTGFYDYTQDLDPGQMQGLSPSAQHAGTFGGLQHDYSRDITGPVGSMSAQHIGDYGGGETSGFGGGGTGEVSAPAPNPGYGANNESTDYGYGGYSTDYGGGTGGGYSTGPGAQNAGDTGGGSFTSDQQAGNAPAYRKGGMIKNKYSLSKMYRGGVVKRR